MQSLAEVLAGVADTADFAGFTVDSVEAQGIAGTRPLHVAAIWGDCEAIEVLLDAGADINAKGEHGHTPLMEAVSQGHVRAVELLVNRGAKGVRNDDGETPSELAEITGNAEIGAILKAKNL